MNIFKRLSFLIISIVLLSNVSVFAEDLDFVIDNLNKEVIEIEFQIGSNIAIINGKSVEMDVSPYISCFSSNTMVPLRFISTILGVDSNNIKYVKGTPEKVYVPISSNLILQITTASAFYNIYKVGENEEIVSHVGTVGEGIPEMLNYSTYIQVRTLADILGWDITWDSSTKKINITAFSLEDFNFDIETVLENLNRQDEENEKIGDELEEEIEALIPEITSNYKYLIVNVYYDKVSVTLTYNNYGDTIKLSSSQTATIKEIISQKTGISEDDISISYTVIY